jgi:putative acetyltransferase
MAISLNDISIRQLQPQDDKAVAAIIRNTLAEFGAAKPGSVYYDPTTDELYQLFSEPCSIYYVAEYQKMIVGGGGIFPSAGLPPDTCELVKMYLIKEARGIGLGSLLIQKCIHFATEAGYQYIYLETFQELKQALHTYAKFGFTYLTKPLGNTGHFGCDLWMLKGLAPSPKGNL